MFCADCKHCDKYLSDNYTIFCKLLKTVVRQTDYHGEGKILKAITKCQYKKEIN